MSSPIETINKPIIKLEKRIFFCSVFIFKNIKAVSNNRIISSMFKS